MATDTGPYGIEVEGHLPRDAPRVAEHYRAHGFVILRDQHLSLDQQAETMAAVGPVLHDWTTVGYVSNARPDGLLGDSEVSFHCDFAFTPTPALGISLHAVDVPHRATRTRFADAHTALQRLPARLRDEIEGRDVLNVFASSRRELAGAQRGTAPHPDAPQAIHPIVATDPATGTQVLTVTEMNASRIIGLSERRSAEVLDELFAHLYAPENVYSHYWANGDIVIWSNYRFHHARDALDPRVTRTLQRVCITTASADQYTYVGGRRP